MPVHPPQWTDFLLCSHCTKEYSVHPDCLPITLLCGHSVCKRCLGNIQTDGCRYDQNTVTPNLSYLPANSALLRIAAYQSNKPLPSDNSRSLDNRQIVSELGHSYQLYVTSNHLIENLAVHLQDIKNSIVPQSSDLTKPMLRKLVSLVQCQLVLEDGRLRALRACRALAERVSTELILTHQNPTTLSGNLWTAVRARGCQFLGPAMQEEALRLILLALEDGSELSRKVLVMFVVQKLQQQFPQASKTSIGHVVQLLYRASCFVVKKRDGDSSLMKLKEMYRTYTALRREHDAQVVQVAREAGLRIAPDQWSALLYGDQSHKSHMQSIIDRLQSGESLKRCIQDLENALDKSNNPQKLRSLIPHFEVLAGISEESTSDQDTQRNDWTFLIRALQSLKIIIQELIDFSKNHGQDSWHDEEVMAQSAKFKTSFCRDVKSKGRCPRGASCTFAHTEEELHHYRNRRKKASFTVAGTQTRDQGSDCPANDSVGYAGHNETHLNQYDDEIREISSDLPVPMMQQREPKASSHAQQYHPHLYPSNFEHSAASHPSSIIPVNGPPIQPDGLAARLLQYGPPFRPALYHPNYESYRQHFPFYPSQNVGPYMQTGALGGSRPIYSDSGSFPATDNTHQNTVKMEEPSVSKFTVTLSFQSNVNQHQSFSNHNFQLPNKASVLFPVGENVQEHESVSKQLIDNKQHQIIVTANRENSGVEKVHQNVLHRGAPTEYTREFFRMQPQSVNNAGQSNFGQQPQVTMRPTDPVMYQVENPVYRPDPMVAPQPIVPPPAPTPTHLYLPNVNTLYPQSPPVGQNLGNSVMIAAASPSPANQPMYVSMLPVPIAPYQVIDQSQRPMPTQIPQMMSFAPPSSMVHSGTIFCTKEQGLEGTSTDKLSVPKSIDAATVQELETRKEQILNKMLEKRRKEVQPAAPVSPETYYDVWKCRSYSPLLTIGGATTVPEHMHPDESNNGLVNVIAELDTGTRQVTMRDSGHTNSSYARGERALDDEKMHRILLERHHDMKNSELVSRVPQPFGAHIHSSRIQEEEDDIIPFSDRPMVSRYGPIARTSRTMHCDSGFAQAKADTQSVASSYESQSEGGTMIDAFSSLETLHAVSCLPLSIPRTRGSDEVSSAQGCPAISSGGSNMSLIQATSNVKLLHREHTALQHNVSRSDTEDLELAMELQQIEIGIHQKKQQQQ